MIIIRCHKDGLLSAQCRPGEALYALGMKPANHRVPAIRYELIVEPWPKFFGLGAVVLVQQKRDYSKLIEILYINEEK